MPSKDPKDLIESALIMPESWKDKLKSQLEKDYYKSLNSFYCQELKSGHTIYPPTNQIFTAFYHCPFDKVSVVIVGQDPYHGPKQAHGMAFSVQKGVPPPPSLQNMFKELTEDPKLEFKRPNHGCLTRWADQGVLLLNTCLTVRSGQANSHQGRGWEKFTDAVISELNKNHKGLVFLLWGKPAEKKCQSVDQKKHFVLKTTHPSPLSAHRGFLGCRHFSQCNDLLAKMGKPTIDWQI
mmetsp:Transcript_1351/g.4131  ORF Transcript_1351/g.4131 Transcript_1351/m.4131 type:complete len:237 (-) Transcript_1351:114-824(-)